MDLKIFRPRETPRPGRARRAPARMETHAGPAPSAPAKTRVASPSENGSHRRGHIYCIESSAGSSFKTRRRGAAFNSPPLYNCKEASRHKKTRNFTRLHNTFSTQKPEIYKNHGETFTNKTEENQDPTQRFTQVKSRKRRICALSKIVTINRI
jgi:hypothetical protein